MARGQIFEALKVIQSLPLLLNAAVVLQNHPQTIFNCVAVKSVFQQNFIYKKNVAEKIGPRAIINFITNTKFLLPLFNLLIVTSVRDKY